MALREESKGIFLGLFDGRICQKCSPKDKGAKSRIDKTGKEVYEKFYFSIYGKLINVTVREHEEFGDSWIVHLRDNDEDYYFQFPFSSRQADGFLRRLPNIKLQDPIEIACGKRDDKPWLTVKQGGEKVKYFWTKEEPRKLPPMVQVMVKGKLTWDDTEKMKYLRWYVNEHAVPELQKLNPVEQIQVQPETTFSNAYNVDPMTVEDFKKGAEQAKAQVQAPTPPPQPKQTEIEDDDLPF